MVIRDPSKSAIQQQNLYSYASVDYTSNKKLVNSSLQFTNSSPQTKQFNDKEKIEQLLGYGMQSYSIDSLIMPITSIKPQISLVESSKPFSAETSKTTQQSNPRVITIDTHPSCNSIPLSYTEIPISYIAKKDINYRQEMEQMIELNRSRCFKTEQYQDGSSYVGEMYNQLRDGFGKYTQYDNQSTLFVKYYQTHYINLQKGVIMKDNGNRIKCMGMELYSMELVKRHMKDNLKMINSLGLEPCIVDHQLQLLYNKEPTKLDSPFDCSNFDLIGNYWVKYVGNFQNELKDGQGALYLSNGECYKGEFYQDYVDGRGTFGSIIGVWRKNQLIK